MLVSYRMERVMSVSAPCLTLFMVLIAGAFSAAPGQSYTDDAVLQYAKPIDVAKLDSTLPSQRLS